jgi:hypothetical protein
MVDQVHQRRVYSAVEASQEEGASGKARQKYPERERKSIGIDVIRIKG